MDGHRPILRSSYSGISLPPLHFPHRPTEQARQTSDPSGLIPPVIQKITVLSEVLRSRPPSATHCRVIAIDGFEPQAVEVLTGYLYESFKARTPHFIRLCPTIPVEVVNSDLRGYSRVITHWDSLWKHFLQVPFPTNSVDAGTPSMQQQHTLPSPKSLPAGPMVEPICINIVPFSPLMLAFKVASKMIPSDLYTEHKLWRWLAEHWRGIIGPDITISVHKHNISLRDRDVVRVCNQNTKTLLVAAGDAVESARNPFSEKQLRRITFEVEKWLRED